MEYLKKESGKVKIYERAKEVHTSNVERLNSGNVNMYRFISYSHKTKGVIDLVFGFNFSLQSFSLTYIFAFIKQLRNSMIKEKNY